MQAIRNLETVCFWCRAGGLAGSQRGEGMRSSLRRSAARGPAEGVPASRRPMSARRIRAAVVGRALLLAATLAVAAALLCTPAIAATLMPSSKQVALIPSNIPPSSPGGLGVMPISSTVSGRADESFDKFSYKYVALSNITSATLSSFDTVALIQVHTSDLSSTAKAALAQFVANGGSSSSTTPTRHPSTTIPGCCPGRTRHGSARVAMPAG
jgi:hypothetical protein